MAKITTKEYNDALSSVFYSYYLHMGRLLLLLQWKVHYASPKLLHLTCNIIGDSKYIQDKFHKKQYAFYEGNHP